MLATREASNCSCMAGISAILAITVFSVTAMDGGW
jgi:hypothetical protein